MTPLLACFLFTLALSDARAARILGLFPHTGRSHQMVFEPLLRTLAERGHEVTVVSFFPINNPPANYTDISLEGIAPVGIETFDIRWVELMPAWPKYLGIQKAMDQVTAFFPLGQMALGVCQKLIHLPSLRDAMRRDYDVVLVENFNSDCMIGLAHMYGITAPKIALLSCNLMPWSAERVGLIENPSYVPLVSSDFSDNMTILQRLENTVLSFVLKYWFYNSVQFKEQEMIEKHFGRKVDLQEQALNMSLIMTNTFPTLNGVRPRNPAMIEVGGMHLNPVRKPIPQYIEKFLNEADEGVILFSWGSLIKTSTIPAHKEQILVNVLSKLPQKVLWKYENSGPEGNLTGNILRVEWLPQYELLQHKKVIAFIAHGGLLGMTEAISAGKPMVVIPFFGDQPQNGERATAIGMGTMVRYADLTEENFREAVTKVLSAETRLNAREASKRWHDRPLAPLDTAVYWTERVARWGHSEVLHSSAKNMPIYQTAMLDIVGVILAIVLIALFIIRLIVKFILHLFWTMFAKQPKKKIH